MVTVEVCAVVVSRVARAQAIAELDEVEVEGVHQVIVVGVSGPHDTHVQAGNPASGQRHTARVSQVLRAFRSPVVATGRERAHAGCEDRIGAGALCGIVAFRRTRFEGKRYRQLQASVGWGRAALPGRLGCQAWFVPYAEIERMI